MGGEKTIRCVLVLWLWGGCAFGGLWEREKEPRELKPPKVETQKIEQAFPTVTPSPQPMPKVSFPEATPTPTPRPGLRPKNPTKAAVLSLVIPGAGHVYSGETWKGILFAGVFGLTLWQSLDNFRLVEVPGEPDPIAKDETAGSLYGLAALAAYGFGIQDAYNAALRYNRKNHLVFSPFQPPSLIIARIVYRF